jgi:hypothetical protein
MSNHTIEFVSFRLRENASVEAFLQESEKVTAWCSALPGFVNRRMSVDGKGGWIDHVEWESAEQAQAATAAFAKTLEIGPFMAMIDPASVDLRHLSLKASVG